VESLFPFGIAVIGSIGRTNNRKLFHLLNQRWLRLFSALVIHTTSSPPTKYLR
jgi:hypothetical protein